MAQASNEGGSIRSGRCPNCGGTDGDRERSPGTVDAAVDAALQRAVDGVRAVAFWSAVTLPLAYVPVLRMGDVSGQPGPFLALLLLHVVSLLLGHEHSPSSAR